MGNVPRDSWEPREADALPVSGHGNLGVRKNFDDTTRSIIHRSIQLTNRVIGRVHAVRNGTYQGKQAVLLVTDFTFIGRHVQITQANVEMIFEVKGDKAKSARNQKEPIVQVVCPSRMSGLSSEEEVESTVEGSGTAGASAGPAQISATINASKKSTSTKHHAVQVTGDFDCDDHHEVPNQAFFEVKGNPKEDFFPHTVFLAVVVKQAFDLQARISVWLNNRKFMSLLWMRDDPLWLPVGQETGSLQPASLEFDKLTTDDWKELVPFHGNRQVWTTTSCSRDSHG